MDKPNMQHQMLRRRKQVDVARAKLVDALQDYLALGRQANVEFGMDSATVQRSIELGQDYADFQSKCWQLWAIIEQSGVGRVTNWRERRRLKLGPPPRGILT